MITYTHVSTELGRSIPPVLASTEEVQWSQWIADTLMLIDDKLGDTALLDQTKLDYVVRKAVAGYVRWVADSIRDIVDENSRVVGQTSPGQGAILILPEWWALLDTDLGDDGAFSIQPYFEADTDATTNLWYPIFT